MRGITYKLCQTALFRTVDKKGTHIYRPEALQTEDFKSCKTLKQENTPQETTKGILTKHGGKSVDNSLGYAIKKLGQKMRNMEKSIKNDK